MIKEEKAKTVENLQKIFSKAKGVYLADFSGINVQMINKLRQQFKNENVTYRIVKNTLTRRSIEGLNYDDLLPYLEGPTALAFSYYDAIAPGKLIEDFFKKNKKLEMKAAIIDGKIYNKDMARKIVELPPKDILIAQLLGTLNSPIFGLVNTLNGVIRKFANVVDQIRELKEKQGDTQSAAEVKAEPADESESSVQKDKSESSVDKDVQQEKTEEAPTETVAADKIEETDKPEEKQPENKDAGENENTGEKE